MAILQLKIHDLVPEDHLDMTLSSDSAEWGTARVGDHVYSLVDISMDKGMYQPTEILADIAIRRAIDKNDGVTPSWTPIGRAKIETMFKHKRATLGAMDNREKGVKMIGDSFYVQEVVTEYYRDGMRVKLKIYTLDKLMTLKKTSRSFTGKRIGEDILTDEATNFRKPYATDESIKWDTANMQQLTYRSTKRNGRAEHIFPYLVQYNESFYDMLARTTNRWGEFMYFEKDKLQFGYEMPDDGSIRKITLEKDFYRITYPNQDTQESLTEMQKDGQYDCEAMYDKNIVDSPVQRDPYLTRGELFATEGFEGQVMTRMLASVFSTESSVTSMLTNMMIDEGVSYLKSLSINGKKNDDVNGEFMGGKGLPEQNGKYNFNLYDDVWEEKDGYNEFTEMKSAYVDANEAYTAERYMKTLAEERKVTGNVAVIDYDTTWPDLQLGEVIEISDEKFIVTGVNARHVTEETDGGKVTKLVFRVTAISQAADGKFYPAMLKTGHVRRSGPQAAQIDRADDPALTNRVRVKFTWQDKGSTPWIPFAAKGDGQNSTGRHNKGTNVMVGFAGGNVERPYVMGAIQEKAPYDGTVDIDLTTPNEHYMRLTDATNKGVHKMALGLVSPLLSGIWSATPGMRNVKIPDFEGTNTPYLDGGFTLSDYYGMYKISGSSIGRNISISSPFGDVKMNAFTGITISAPNGDVKIKGKNVTIEAGNNLKLTSGTNIKKYFIKAPESGWALLDPLTIAAERVLTDVGNVVDFNFLRHVLEIQFRPIEGVTEIKSNRYLKLESGGSSTGYPDGAYEDARGKAYKELKGSKWYRMGDGIGALILAMGRYIDDWTSMYKKRYAAAYRAKQAFDFAVYRLKWMGNVTLDQLVNDPAGKVCDEYEDLRERLYNDDTKSLTVADLHFNNKVGADADSEVSADCHARCHANDKTIRKRRAVRKLEVVRKANTLLKAVKALKKMEMTDREVDRQLGFFWELTKHLPKNFKGAVKKALSEEKCRLSGYYTTWLSANSFSLTAQEPNQMQNATEPEKLALKRLVALNLLEEFGIKAKVRTQVNPETFGPVVELHTLFTSQDDLINNWQEKMGSVMLCPPLGELEEEHFWLRETAAAKGKELIFASLAERGIWSDAKSGKILLSSGGKPQMLDGTIKDIDALYSKGKLRPQDVLEPDEKRARDFAKKIWKALGKLDNQNNEGQAGQAAQEMAHIERVEILDPVPPVNPPAAAGGNNGQQPEQQNNNPQPEQQNNNAGNVVPVVNEVGLNNQQNDQNHQNDQNQHQDPLPQAGNEILVEN